MVSKIKSTKPNVIFVASESRSGSTLLDLLLGNQDEYVSVGEMRQLQGISLQDYCVAGFRDQRYPLICTCGQPLDTCKFWKSVEVASGLSFKTTSFKGSAPSSWKKLIQVSYLIGGRRLVRGLGSLFPVIGNELKVASNCFQVYDAIGEFTGARYIVDSSKDIYHYLLLKMMCPGQVKLVILHRDGRAVAFSQVRSNRSGLWPSDEQLSPFAQAVKHWVRVNRNILLFSNRTKKQDKYVLRYEDLCTDPQKSLERLLKGLRADVPALSTELQKVDRHNLGGSPSRLDLSQTTIQLDERWRKEISARQLEEFDRFGSRMNRILGYLE